jgi:hypothetical protein
MYLLELHSAAGVEVLVFESPTLRALAMIRFTRRRDLVLRCVDPHRVS